MWLLEKQRATVCCCIRTVMNIFMYLSVRAFLLSCLHHDVAFQAHLEVRDLCRYAAVTRRPQRSQELASSHRVHNHRSVLTSSEHNTRSAGAPALTFHGKCLFMVIFIYL